MGKEEKTSQLKYAQQHLANERTYLAWIRTSIAIIGIGLLMTSLHFSGNITPSASNAFEIMLGIITGFFFFGMVIIIIATTSYLSKKKQIENQSFYSSHMPIVFVSFILIAIAIIVIFCVLSQW
ncbi:YidH family protein [Virgibacillus ihumii]|uniref:YidH family protein n=1 Tax=Virgibacillus ihumii TaxID=2686091 RepID=UPI00157CCCC6|nr:DUF202 domain-containing protein [Virgibacillus ihumii]